MFRRGRLRPNKCWWFNGTVLETVNDFNYLNVVFDYTRAFALNQ